MLYEVITPPLTEPVKNSGTYRAVTEVKELAELIDRGIQMGMIAFDTETTGLNVLKDRLVGFSLSVEEGTGAYVPLRGPQAELGEESHPLMAQDKALEQIARLFSVITSYSIHYTKLYEGSGLG